MANDCRDDELRELYANYFQIGHNSAEFLLDFGRHFEGGEERFHQRIITNPASAKVLSRMLRESIDNYEERFGVILGDTEG